MANVIKHKRGSGSDPAANNLVIGELAIRTDTGKLFTKMDSGAIAEIAGGGSDIAINTLSSSSGTGGGSATFNGSAYRFTLSAPPSVSAAQLLVSINGVIQKPVAGTGQPSEGFSVDGTDIILGDAPATGSDFFILTFKSLGVSEPADNTVTSAKIVDGAIVNADVNASAAIAGSKIDPTFTSTVNVTNNLPEIFLTDSNSSNARARINANGGGLLLGADNDNAHANSSISFEVDGSNKMFINSSGNVGIGTTSPTDYNNLAENLVVATSSDTGITVASGTSSQGSLFFADGTSGSAMVEGFVAYEHGSNFLKLGTSNAERMRIDSSGNVGIGTTSPNELLHLSGNSSGAISAKIENTYSSDANRFAILELKSGVGSIRFHDQGDTIEGEIKYDTTTNSMRFATNGNSERMRIDSSGRVGIGTTSPNYELQVNDSSGTISVLQLTNTTTGSGAGDGLLMYITGNDTIISNEEAGYMRFQTSGLERMRIDSAGNVGIGETSPANLLHVKVSDTGVAPHASAQIVLERAGTNYLQFLTANTGTSGILFGDGDDNDVAQIKYDHNVPAMQFLTETAERMRIDSAGNIMFGTTSNSVFDDTSGSGVVIRGATGALDIMRNNDHPLLLNRTGGDGQMCMYHRDGVNKAASALRSGHLCFDLPSGTEKIRFQSTGGISFNGDTAAANALDDYEEGTWTPTFDTNAGTNTSGNCTYIKIGRVVHCFFRATHPTTSSSSYATITGLPFTSLSRTVGAPGGAFSETNAGENLSFIVNPNTTYAFILRCDNSGVAVVTQSSISGKDFRGCITYETT